MPPAISPHTHLEQSCPTNSLTIPYRATRPPKVTASCCTKGSPSAVIGATVTCAGVHEAKARQDRSWAILPRGARRKAARNASPAPEPTGPAAAALLAHALRATRGWKATAQADRARQDCIRRKISHMARMHGTPEHPTASSNVGNYKGTTYAVPEDTPGSHLSCEP